ncbi:hypothetical protein EVAR_48537_1 [Eumeta japonica]|uniref:Uncharacterized protein n=1 Tax=Eumeta variegata TaxID=151549 RepID=A0A4C1YAT7_EUMVA|nr:hypothetical protein EVAR_48537_1 [Eumeta japonica]
MFYCAALEQIYQKRRVFWATRVSSPELFIPMKSLSNAYEVRSIRLDVFSLRGPVIYFEVGGSLRTFVQRRTPTSSVRATSPVRSAPTLIILNFFVTTGDGRLRAPNERPGGGRRSAVGGRRPAAGGVSLAVEERIGKNLTANPSVETKTQNTLAIFNRSDARAPVPSRQRGVLGNSIVPSIAYSYIPCDSLCARAAAA